MSTDTLIGSQLRRRANNYGDDVDLEDGEIEDEGEGDDQSNDHQSNSNISSTAIAPSTPTVPITPKSQENRGSPPVWMRNSPREIHSSPISGGSPLNMKTSHRLKKGSKPAHNSDRDRNKSWGSVKPSKGSEDSFDDDWAGNIQKKLWEAMNKDELSKTAGQQLSPSHQDSGKDDDDYQRGKKKRKRKKFKEDEDERSPQDIKKRKNNDREGDEEGMDDEDDTTLYIRGASPSRQGFYPTNEREEDNFSVGESSFNERYDSYGEEESEWEGRRRDGRDTESPGRFRRDRDDDDSVGGRGSRGASRGGKMTRRGVRGGQTPSQPVNAVGSPMNRGTFIKRGIKRGAGRGNVNIGKPTAPRPRMQGERQPEGICSYFMQGKCHKSAEDCPYSHDAVPLRKMELCKFYMKDCCAKRDKCLYMHHDFPCKFFHTGLECQAGERNCKFSHGKLNDIQLDVLIKHLETAPKEILGHFPRLSRDEAIDMVRARLVRSVGKQRIPSLMDISVPVPQEPEEESRYSSGEEGGDGSRTPMPSSPFEVRRNRRPGSPDSLEMDGGPKDSGYGEPILRGGTPRDAHLRDAPPREGSPRDGPQRDGPTRDKPLRDGPLRDGPMRDGPMRDGPMRDGSSRDGPLRDGPPRDGPLRDGPSREGPLRDGPLRDGPLRDGPLRDGPSRDGPLRDGPLRDGPLRDGPHRDGSHRDGPQREGPSRDGYSRDNHQRDGRPRDGHPRDVASRDQGSRRHDDDSDSKRRDHDRRDRRRDHHEPRDRDQRRRRRRWNSPEDERSPHDDRWDSRRQSRFGGDRNSREDKNPTGRHSFGGRDPVESERASAEAEGRGVPNKNVEDTTQERNSLEGRMPGAPDSVASGDRDDSREGEESGDSHDAGGLPVNMPKRQRELFLRIQQHVQQRESEDSSMAAAAQEDEEAAPEDDWYSSDDDDDASITDVLKNLKSLDQKKKSSKEKTSETTGDGVESGPRPRTPPITASPKPAEAIPVTTPSGVVLADISQIQISNEITKLLSSIRHGTISTSTSSTSTTAPPLASPGLSEATSTPKDEGVPVMPAATATQLPAATPTPAPVRDPRLSARDPRQRAAAPSPPQVPAPSPAIAPRPDPRTAPRPDPRVARADPRVARADPPPRPDPRVARADPRLDSRGVASTAPNTSPSGAPAPVQTPLSAPSSSPALAPSSSPAGADTPAALQGRRTSDSQQAQRTSIYDTALVNLPGDVDLRMRSDALGSSDVDLRSRLSAGDMDMRIGQRDVDLRVGPGPLGDLERDYLQNDVDLRSIQMMLPFKPAPMHIPCTEIDASISSYPPRPYRVVVITIPRPDYTNLKVNVSDPQVRADPRLRRVFRLSQDEQPSNPLLGPLSSPVGPAPALVTPTPALVTPPAAPSAPLSDPRQRKVSASSVARPTDPRQARLSTSTPVCPPTPRLEDTHDIPVGDTDLRYFTGGHQSVRPTWPQSSRSVGPRGMNPFHHQRSYTPPPS